MNKAYVILHVITYSFIIFERYQMRKFSFLAIFFIFITLLSIFPGTPDNLQKIYPQDSDIYSAITTLYYIQGKAAPSTTSPYSKAELVKMLNQIDKASLKENERYIYSYIEKQLEIKPQFDKTDLAFTVGVSGATEAYIHTNTDTIDTNIVTQFKKYPVTAGYFIGRQNWIRGFKEQNPLLSIFLETWPGEYIYSYAELSLGNTNTLENGFGSTKFASNLMLVKPNNLNDLDCNMPYRAFVSAGTSNWSIELGRDRASWGLGESGNLFLGDNFPYHNMGRFTTFGKNFKYTFFTSFFPHPSSYYEQGEGPYKGDDQEQPLKGLYMFMAHRLEWRIFEKLTINATESIMYQDQNGSLDLRVLNPVMLFHDYYIRANSNSLLGFDINYTPFKGFTLYGQIVIDDLGISAENDIHNPNACGYLLGTKYTTLINNLVSTTSLEAVYTDPYLYLRDSYKDSKFPLNYTAAFREFTNFGPTMYHQEFLGYKYGNDVFTVNLKSKLQSLGKWDIEGNILYMAHGTFDSYTIWERITKAPQAPTTSYPDGNYADDNTSNRDSIEHTLVFTLKGNYIPYKNLSIFSEVDFITIKNYKNHSSLKNINDFQLSFGIKYTIK